MSGMIGVSSKEVLHSGGHNTVQQKKSDQSLDKARTELITQERYHSNAALVKDGVFETSAQLNQEIKRLNFLQTNHPIVANNFELEKELVDNIKEVYTSFNDELLSPQNADGTGKKILINNSLATLKSLIPTRKSTGEYCFGGKQNPFDIKNAKGEIIRFDIVNQSNIIDGHATTNYTEIDKNNSTINVSGNTKVNKTYLSPDSPMIKELITYLNMHKSDKYDLDALEEQSQKCYKAISWQAHVINEALDTLGKAHDRNSTEQINTNKLKEKIHKVDVLDAVTKVSEKSNQQETVYRIVFQNLKRLKEMLQMMP